jgi:sugar phosphate isomerase/epimerase
MIRIGSASAPRWYEGSRERLDEFVDCLAEWGAGSTELVLHHGDADLHTARVHVLEDDWLPVLDRYLSRGIQCHIHAPLHPRFKIERWRTDRSRLRGEFLPIFQVASALAERQPDGVVLVIHAANGPDGRETTAAWLEWALQELSEGVNIAIELRTHKPESPDEVDRGRESLAGFVRDFGADQVGICWDIANDWQSRTYQPGWREAPERDFLDLVNHVHLHDIGGPDALSHFPLQAGQAPWREMLPPLVAGGYRGAITLEIRYRCALALGEPWAVLGESYRLVGEFLNRAGVEN